MNHEHHPSPCCRSHTPAACRYAHRAVNTREDPPAFVVDGANLAKLGHGRSVPDLERVRSARDALGTRFPNARIVLFFDRSELRFGRASFQRYGVDADAYQAYARALREALSSEEIFMPAAGVRADGDARFLELAEQTGAAIVTFDRLSQHVEDHPWLRDEGRYWRPQYEATLGAWLFVSSKPATISTATQPRAARRTSASRTEDGVGIAVGSVQDHHLETFRITDRGRVQHRWFPDDEGNVAWSDWADFGFDQAAQDVATASGWPSHLEVFILARDGQVWHRWWWAGEGWDPGFHELGRPYRDGTAGAQAIAAASLRHGHLDVQVRASDGSVKNVWYIDRADLQDDDPDRRRWYYDGDWGTWWTFSGGF